VCTGATLMKRGQYSVHQINIHNKDRNIVLSVRPLVNVITKLVQSYKCIKIHWKTRKQNIKLPTQNEISHLSQRQCFRYRLRLYGDKDNNGLLSDIKMIRHKRAVTFSPIILPVSGSRLYSAHDKVCTRLGRAITQAVRRQLPTAAARVQTRV
jgi:hypothetical protein